MSQAHHGDDDLAFYHADIGETRGPLQANAVAPVQFADVLGPLSPGRYLIQVTDLGGSGRQFVWVGMGAYGSTIPLTASAGLQRFPFSSGGLIALEVNVRRGYNDQVAAITTSSTADVYVSKVSRERP